MRDYFQIALQYCDDVRTGVRTAGKLEKLAVKRFLNDLTRSFLSCLLGSERYPLQLLSHCIFLSCLLGSEPPQVDKVHVSIFLSCLLGSERLL